MNGSRRAARRTTRTSFFPPCVLALAAIWKNQRLKVMNRNSLHSDALVFFGATGDLAYKKIFPALQAMVKRGKLDVPVVGVAKAGWNLDQLRARARDSVKEHGGLDAAAFDTLCGMLR